MGTRGPPVAKPVARQCGLGRETAEILLPGGRRAFCILLVSAPSYSVLVPTARCGPGKLTRKAGRRGDVEQSVPLATATARHGTGWVSLGKRRPAAIMADSAPGACRGPAALNIWPPISPPPIRPSAARCQIAEVATNRRPHQRPLRARCRLFTAVPKGWPGLGRRPPATSVAHPLGTVSGPCHTVSASPHDIRSYRTGQKRPWSEAGGSVRPCLASPFL